MLYDQSRIGRSGNNKIIMWVDVNGTGRLPPVDPNCVSEATATLIRMDDTVSLSSLPAGVHPHTSAAVMAVFHQGPLL